MGLDAVFNPVHPRRRGLRSRWRVPRPPTSLPGFDLLRHPGLLRRGHRRGGRLGLRHHGHRRRAARQEGALPGLRHGHPVRQERATRSIAWQAHVAMMAATQPFVSGAISKTINMPNSATFDDVKGAYMTAWKSMLKSHRPVPGRLEALPAAVRRSRRRSDPLAEGLLAAAIRGRRRPMPARRTQPPRQPGSAASVRALPAQPARRLHAEGQDRRTLRIPAHRRIRRRPPGRDIPRHAQGRRGVQEPPQLVRHRRIARACSTAYRWRNTSTPSPSAASSRTAWSRATSTSRWPRACSTTCSATWP